MSINTKELCRQIKKSNFIIWSLQAGYHYVTNRHWAVKYKELPREVLVQLFTKFADKPKEDGSISCRKGDDVVHSSVDVKGIFDKAAGDCSPGAVTPYIKMSGDLRMRVLKHNNHFIFVDEEYINVLNDPEQDIPQCKGRLHPILFAENSFLVLPYRTEKVEVEILGELVGLSS